MDFGAFKRKYKPFPLIKSSFFALDQKPGYLRRLVSEWTRKGWLVQVRRGIYIVNDEGQASELDPFLIANGLYEPSYISRESALSFHGLIPESVQQVTSVGTRKTASFTSSLGTYLYSNVNENLFFGFSRHRLSSGSALIAGPEKALLDLLHLRRGEFGSAEEVVESLRITELSLLNSRTLRSSVNQFKSRHLFKIVDGFVGLLPKREARS